MNINRKSFLKMAASASVLAASGLSLSACGNPENAGVNKSGNSSSQTSDFTEMLKFGGKPAWAKIDYSSGKVERNKDIIVRQSVCLGCYGTCGSSVRLDRKSGTIINRAGNPRNPIASQEFINFDDSMEAYYQAQSYLPNKGNQQRGSLCGRGNATLESYFGPNRITVPLKRAGKRGEGKWKTISWKQLIDEVVEGGKLFEEIGEQQEVQGFKALYDHETLISEGDPEFGPICNQLSVVGGRGDGRTQISPRFTSAFGTVNYFSHHGS